MIRIEVRNLAAVQAAMRNLAEEEIPFAMSSGLNSTAFAVQKASRAHLEGSFDRPTPLVKGATRVEKATKAALTARTFIDDRRNLVLTVHEEGGKRNDQRLERFLQGKGWLPTGWRAIPTGNMPLNAYGNPQQAEVTRIINGLPSIGGISGARRYFVIPAGRARGLSAGVYRALGRGAGVLKLYSFASRAEYRPELKWLPNMEAEARRILPDLMSAAVRRAIETAR